MKRSKTGADAAEKAVAEKRVRMCDDVLRAQAKEDANLSWVIEALEDADPERIHDALCRATVQFPWDASRDPLEDALARAEASGWQAALNDQRAAARDFNVFSHPAKCPTCGVVGLYVYEVQMRRADEPATSVRQCPNGHKGQFHHDGT